MQENMSIWHLVASADTVVKFILLLLLVVSVFSWALMIERTLLLAKSRRVYKAFEAQFWSGIEMSALSQKLKQQDTDVGISAIFLKGYGAFVRFQRGENVPTESVVSHVSRVLKVAFMRENDRLQGNISALGTIGAVSPYVGLFGTVWGIMGAFQALSSVQQVTLAMVAPGISEALIATAMGLFVAIPAVIGFNRLSTKADFLLNDYENFQDEFVSIIDRQMRAPHLSGHSL